MRSYGRSPETEARFNVARALRVREERNAHEERITPRGLRGHAHHFAAGVAALAVGSGTAVLGAMLALLMMAGACGHG